MIIINGRFLLHRVTGVERYAREILAELDHIAQPGEYELAVPPGVEELPMFKNIAITRHGRFKNILWEHVSFPIYVHQRHGISLNLCNTAPLPAPGIVCIHDVKIKACPQFFSKKFLMWYNLLFSNETKRAKAILTVSAFSGKEISHYYHVPAGKIHVIPNGWQHYERTAFDEGALKKYGLDKGAYYFSMCSLEPNKNFRWIAEAARKNVDCVFAVAGAINKTVFSDGFGFDCPSNMKLLGYVSDGEAKTLMRDCKAFLFPTFYEGFGIPPLEALSAGAKNVIVSDTEVMHEVFGNSVNYVDPFTIPDQFVFPEPANRKEPLARYSWEKSAKKLKQALDEIIAEVG